MGHQPDQVDNRKCKCASPTETPQKGITDEIAINPNAKYIEKKRRRSVSVSARVFHELAEAYAKTDGGKPYSDFQTLGVVGGDTLEISIPNQGAHNEAVKRELVLRNQRPELQSTGRAGDQLVRDPHN